MRPVRAIHCEERDFSLVVNGSRNHSENSRVVALSESARHLLPGVQCVLCPIHFVEHDPSVVDGFRDRLEKNRGLVLPESEHHIVPSSQCFLFPIHPGEYLPLGDEGLRGPLAVGVGFTLPVPTRHLVASFQRFFRPVLIIQGDRRIEEVSCEPIRLFAGGSREADLSPGRPVPGCRMSFPLRPKVPDRCRDR